VGPLVWPKRTPFMFAGTDTSSLTAEVAAAVSDAAMSCEKSAS
jgi:hypothetical protein